MHAHLGITLAEVTAVTIFSAHSLLDAILAKPDGEVRTRAVLPFFTSGLQVQFLLVALPDGQCFVLRDLPDAVSGRTLHYKLAPANQLPLAQAPASEIAPLLHYDPWWLLRGRDDIPKDVRDAAIGTNIAELEIEGRKISTLCFDDGLSSVVGARVPRRLLGSRFIPREDLFQVFR
jgi:hypothetical protein